MSKRRGLGKGLGKGYKNITPPDPAIHSMSAKGIKQKGMVAPISVKRFKPHKIEPTMSEYQKEAYTFLNDTQTEFKAKYVKHDLYFPDDKEPRDIYQITLKRGDKKYSFRFGQSIADSNGATPPTPYDVLASVQKYEVGTFEDFASEFGYDEDSTAKKIYKAVVKEYDNLKRLYSEAELDKMSEIA